MLLLLSAALVPRLWTGMCLGRPRIWLRCRWLLFVLLVASVARSSRRGPRAAADADSCRSSRKRRLADDPQLGSHRSCAASVDDTSTAASAHDTFDPAVHAGKQPDDDSVVSAESTGLLVPWQSSVPLFLG